MEQIQAAAATLGITLPPDAAPKLAALAELIGGVGVEAGVIAPGDAAVVLERHILDSLRAVSLLGGAKWAYDLGSGGGLPGLVVAICRPAMIVRLVDRRRRKVGFVELAADRLGLSNAISVLSEIRELTEASDLCLARALAPPEVSWELASPLLNPGGRLIYFAGQGFSGVSGLPELVSCETVRDGLLATSGPLAIMTRT